MILKHFNNIIALPSILVFIYKSYKQQKQFMKESIFLDIKAIEERKDKSLTENDLEKIKVYYGLSVSVIADCYCQLKGQRLKGSERRTLTYLGGTTGLFDDFFDKKNISNEHIKELVCNPSIKICHNSHERLFIQLYLKALEQEHSNRIKKYCNILYDSQVLSKKQTNPNITPDEIFHITKQKGGMSILLYRAALEGSIDIQEKELLTGIGLLGQLENDIFDLYKDYQEGIFTLANTTKSITELQNTYWYILDTVYRLIAQMNFRTRNKKRFSRLIAIIATRGMVCLAQLKNLTNDETFEIQNYSRNQLICDMSKTKNIIKWIAFYLNWDR